MALMVAKSLSALGEGVSVVPDTESGQPALEFGYEPADFVIQQLDLRIRIALCVSISDPTELSLENHMQRAALILRHWPETASVALVANDDAQNCLLLEPFDVEQAIGSPSGNTRHQGGLTPKPLAESVREYLALSIPTWERLPENLVQPPEPSSRVVGAQAERAKDLVVGRRAIISEKLAALDSISQDDVRWAARLAELAIDSRLSEDALIEGIASQAGESDD